MSRAALSLVVSLLIGIVAPSTAAAQALEVTITNPNVNEAEVRSNLGDAVDSELRLSDQSEFLDQMVHATLLAAKGMGTDYASSPQKFVLGVSIGSGLAGNGFGFGYGSGLLPSGGFAFQMAVTGGLNLGWLAGSDGFARRVVLYGHGMGVSGARDPFESSAAAFGGHVQVAVVKPQSEGSVGWGGLQATTGFEYARYELSLNQAVPFESAAANWNADGSYVVEASGMSIPLELSTNMRLGFLSLFGGGALDFDMNAGSSSEVALDGPLVADVNGSEQEVGTARVSVTDAVDGGGVAPRFFAGLQINILPVKLYGQLNMAAGRGFGGHAGIRVAM